MDNKSNRRPLLLRTFAAVVIIAVFFIAIHPIRQRDFYETFCQLVIQDSKSQATELCLKAQQAAGLPENKEKYPSEILLEVANANDVNLVQMLPPNSKITGNRDVIAATRKAASGSIRLGLDLAGGVEFIVKLMPDPNSSEHSEVNRDKAIEILRERLENNKITEAEITPLGAESDMMISVKAPIVSRDEKVNLRNLIEMSAKLRFSMVHPDNAKLVADYLSAQKSGQEFKAPLGYTLMSEQKEGKGDVRYYFVANKVEMDGKNIIAAHPASDQYGQRHISLRFNSQGAADFARVTENNVGREMAIVLDGRLYCAPTIQVAIKDGAAVINGAFSTEELTNISNALTSGSFPYIIKVDGVFDTDPKLGADNVNQSIYAGLVALAIVVAFMVIYYLFSGFVAVAALSVNVVLVLGALAAFDATLTLPGIAGIILTIGMAVDANVLIFERIREELQSGKSIRNAVDVGYSKAFSAVFDANITTLFIALILGSVGTGAIKGFAVTLGIGIITSLFTALFLTRLIFDYLLRFTSIAKLPMLQFVRDPKINFLAIGKYCMMVSGVLIVLSLALFAARNKDMCGIDFVGGASMTFECSGNAPISQLDALFKREKIPASFTYKTAALDDSVKRLEVQVRGEGCDPKRIEQLLSGEFPDSGFILQDSSSIGGLVGWQFTKRAIFAVLLSFVGIVLYVTFRYEFSYAMAAIMALVHDVIVASGIFVISGGEFSLPVIAALLTIIGYSINDTIVIFDRIRENAALHPEEAYRKIVNLSINDTLNRTLLTSITTLLVVLVMLVGGGDAIRDFVFVMMLGIVIGTYSSIFISSSIVAVWHRKIGRKNSQGA